MNEDKIDRLRRVCRVVSMVLLLIIAFNAIILCIVVYSAIGLVIDPDFSFSDLDREQTMWQAVYYAVLCVTTIFMQFSLYRITKTLSTSKSPFVMSIAVSMKRIAVIMISLFFMTVAISAGMVYCGVEGVGRGAMVGFLVAGLVIYALAIVFEYGVSLQEESDSFL